MLSEEGAREQSIYENSGEPIPRPRINGQEYSNPNQDVEIKIYENWIYRSRRSHKPYPYDTADGEFKEKIKEEWVKKENDDYYKICLGVATATRVILDHTI